MAYQVMKQPNGKLAVWCTVGQEIVVYDATVDDVIDYMVAQQRILITQHVERIVADVVAGKPFYGSRTLSWGDALEYMKRQHGLAAVEEILLNMEKEEKPHGKPLH